MNLVQVKQEMNQSVLELAPATNAEGVVNKEWLRHWDNDNRISVSIHVDTVKQIKENPAMNNLGVQTETREGNKGEYTSYRVVAYDKSDVVATL